MRKQHDESGGEFLGSLVWLKVPFEFQISFIDINMEADVVVLPKCWFGLINLGNMLVLEFE